ncbi:helix-turn-helix transcriptional regulator [Bacillus thuringiensis]|nr:helix-turn-helix transcriptional regulator [Bacillus thuringiensis]
MPKKDVHKEFKHIAQQLRNIRESRNWTLVEASQKIGIGFVFLSEIERALKAPSAEAIAAISRVYDLDECEIAVQYKRIPLSVSNELSENREILRMMYDVINNKHITDEARAEFYSNVMSLYSKIEK